MNNLHIDTAIQAAYDVANRNYTESCAAHNAIVKKYRERLVDDAVFLASRRLRDAAMAAWERANDDMAAALDAAQEAADKAAAEAEAVDTNGRLF